MGRLATILQRLAPHKQARLRGLLRPLSIGPLSARELRGLDAELDAGIVRILPVLGPAFGARVVLFGFWDLWLDPAAAPFTVPIRCLLVGVGALGYAANRLDLSDYQRCTLIYASHSLAMVASSALLPNGLVLGLPGLTAPIFPLALVEPRVRRLLAISAAPAVLYLLLAFHVLPPRIAISCAVMCLVAAALASSVALAGKRLRADRYLLEQALLRAARCDSLSGPLTRGCISEVAGHDIALAQRHMRPLAVAMLDIDHGKRVNDT